MFVFELITIRLVHKLAFAAVVGILSKWFYGRRRERQVSCPSQTEEKST